MPTAGVGAARFARGAGLSVVSVALSAVAHLLGGGHVPPAGVLLAMAAVLLPVGVLVAGRQVRTVLATAVLGAEQLVLHAAYGVVMACGPATPGAATSGHVHGAAAGVALAGACLPQGHVGAHPVLGGAAMLAFHAVATVATAVLVAGAERLLWWVRDEVAARLAPLPAPGPVSPSGGGCPVTPRTTPVASHRPRLRPARRGPPAFPAPAVLPS